MKPQQQLVLVSFLVINLAAAAAAAAAADYQYNTRPDSNYGPGQFHDGFLRVADQLWDNGMKEALDAAVAAGDVGNIIISGHSLGAAAGNLLVSRAQVCHTLPNHKYFVLQQVSPAPMTPQCNQHTCTGNLLNPCVHTAHALHQFILTSNHTLACWCYFYTCSNKMGSCS
jgi:hypothetical protein